MSLLGLADEADGLAPTTSQLLERALRAAESCLTAAVGGIATSVNALTHVALAFGDDDRQTAHPDHGHPVDRVLESWWRNSRGQGCVDPRDVDPHGALHVLELLRAPIDIDIIVPGLGVSRRRVLDLALASARQDDVWSHDASWLVLPLASRGGHWAHLLATVDLAVMAHAYQMEQNEFFASIDRAPATLPAAFASWACGGRHLLAGLAMAWPEYWDDSGIEGGTSALVHADHRRMHEEVRVLEAWPHGSSASKAAQGAFLIGHQVEVLAAASMRSAATGCRDMAESLALSVLRCIERLTDQSGLLEAERHLATMGLAHAIWGLRALRAPPGAAPVRRDNS